ncbi:DUF1152 domain-containing protein [Staphylothermus hellenicus]|uniref:DUF1152 domain-containing protein n=1 Tax=Staphylothermus hellenicus (strain DSM 12710 / JCM 10830 / BK20S6-10-b1 / P8) TaxID=591019 RepID=D7DAG2_STAHD|nr:DUF1152 domain-containing protein [Staphylothermus hellenicus]ADI31159.1 protein of unknown function DUF1152 [Staphylothermus hellenicus DSM 12710]
MLGMFSGNDRVLVIGIGGGGDVVSAAVIAYMLRKLGVKTYIGSIVWERFVYDPVPGPVHLGEMRKIKLVDRYVGVIDQESYAVRNGRKIVFQAVNVSRALNEEIFVFDLWSGVKGYVEGVNRVAEKYSIDKIVGVDVGGDVLAEGYEDNLWSPLADAMGLAMLYHFKNSYLIIHSPGSDGELSQEYVLQRLSIIASMKGYYGAIGLDRNDIEILEKILKYAESEASRAALVAFQGFYGNMPIRRNTRSIKINLINTLMFITDPRITYGLSKPAQLVDNTSSLEEANNKLDKAGIYTEYNLEKDIQSLNVDPLKLSGEEILNIRKNGIRKLRMMNDQSTD